MLLSTEIADLAIDMREQSKGRPYVGLLMPGVATDDTFWRMLIEMFEIVLHQRGYVVARRQDVVKK